MSDVTLIRHGQANSGSTEEASYDKLSDLGHRQAAWLGDYLERAGERYDRIYMGALVRHGETAAAMDVARWGEPIVDPRLNEVAYFDLSNKMHEQMGIAIPQTREAFIEHLPLVFTAWEEGRIEGAQETFRAFQERVDDVMHEMAAGKGRALAVTSGGLISMAFRVTMGLEMTAFARTALAIMNTSMHQFQPIGSALSMTQFNAVPHLADPKRRFAQTFV